jgi:Ca2+/H+ antiporter
MKHLNVLLLCIPATIIERFSLRADESIVFITSFLAIVPLAIVVGDAIEQIAINTSPKVDVRPWQIAHFH